MLFNAKNIFGLTLFMTLEWLSKASTDHNVLSCVGGRLLDRQSDSAFRPKWHFTPPQNWMNDPIRMVYYREHYHLFYQFNPCGSTWGNMTWGHAVSEDMLHWQDKPVAIWGQDQVVAIFTGSIFVDGDDITAYFTAVTEMPIFWEITYIRGMETQHSAKPVTLDAQDPSDALDAWQHEAGWPHLGQPPTLEDLNNNCVTGWRDPIVWANAEGRQFMVISGGLRGGYENGTDYTCSGEFLGGAVFLYERPDKTSAWEFVKVMHTAPVQDLSINWECAAVVETAGQHILTFGSQPADNIHDRRTHYIVGSFEETTGDFVPNSSNPFGGRLDWGGLYAATSWTEEWSSDDYAVYMGWADENWEHSSASFQEAGWSGVMSVPRTLSLTSGGAAVSAPHPNVDSLHGESETFTLRNAGLQTVEVSDELIRHNTYDLQTSVSCAEGGNFTLHLMTDPDIQTEVTEVARSTENQIEMTILTVDCDLGEAVVDRSKSSLNCETDFKCGNEEHIPFEAKTEPVSIRVLVDVSILEIWVDGKALTTRVYPTLPGSYQVQAEASKDAMLPVELLVYSMEHVYGAKNCEQDSSLTDDVADDSSAPNAATTLAIALVGVLAFVWI